MSTPNTSGPAAPKDETKASTEVDAKAAAKAAATAAKAKEDAEAAAKKAAAKEAAAKAKAEAAEKAKAAAAEKAANDNDGKSEDTEDEVKEGPADRLALIKKVLSKYFKAEAVGQWLPDVAAAVEVGRIVAIYGDKSSPVVNIEADLYFRDRASVREVSGRLGKSLLEIVNQTVADA